MPPRNPPGRRPPPPVVDLAGAVYRNWVNQRGIPDWLDQQRWLYREGMQIETDPGALREQFEVAMSSLASRDAIRRGGDPRAASRGVLANLPRNVPMPLNWALPRGIVDVEFLGDVKID